MIICAECDAEMFVGDEEAKPVMLITGDIETESERLDEIPPSNRPQASHLPLVRGI